MDNDTQMTKNLAVLVVDDERAIRDMICMALEKAGYHCLEASDAHKAEALLREQLPAMILLDWMMPGISGVDFVRKLRRQEETSHIPVIMLTAKTEEEDVIRGLQSGADDYLTKPFSTRELLARMQALLRRTQPATAKEILESDGLSLNISSHRVSSHNQHIDLGPTEFRLLRFLMENQERVFSREQLLNHVWGDSVYVEERTVDVHIRRLRKALETTGHDKLVQTVRGSGYRFSSHH